MTELKKITNSREEILAEIADYKKEHPTYWHSFFNNFWTNLPNVKYPDNGPRRHLFKKVGAYDTIQKDWYAKKAYADDLTLQYHSQKYLNQTGKEFFDDIDDSMHKTGISSEEVLRLSDPKTGNLRLLYEKTIPVYVDLRLKGYSHFDLTG